MKAGYSCSIKKAGERKSSALKSPQGRQRWGQHGTGRVRQSKDEGGKNLEEGYKKSLRVVKGKLKTGEGRQE